MEPQEERWLASSCKARVLHQVGATTEKAHLIEKHLIVAVPPACLALKPQRKAVTNHFVHWIEQVEVHI